MRFEKEKLEQKLKYEAKIEENRKCQIKEQSINAKLPKLQITRFNGTHTDWLRFWNQFKAEIDSADVPQITKFSYLTELLEPRVRITVDGLPFTIEGYERAKSILNTNYGKVSEIVNAYVNNVMSLPAIHGTNPNKIMEFYQKLSPNLQALETMGKLKEINGYVRMTLDKLEGIKGDLVRTDDNWQEWDFPKLLEALRKWTERNPPKLEDKYQQEKPTLPKPPRSRTYQANQQDPRRKPCVYCDNSSHQSINCDKVTTIQERRRLLNVKQLCFNCTGANHKASECRSTSTCRICKRRHHSSICEKTSQHQEHMLVATGRGAVTYPVVVVNVGGIHCRALLDTGAGSSYASAALLDRLRKQPVRKELKRIEMMMQATTREIEIHEVVVKSLSGAFQLRTEVTKVNRGVLLSLGNPGYKDMIGRYHHLKGVEMDDIDTKRDLPVHLILGASEYAQVKTETTPRIGKPGEPIAEWTRLGWTILSPGSEPNLTSMFLTQTSAVDYENLCRLDVLGLQDHSVGDQDLVYEEFKEQLLRDPEGWYETGLLWKGNHSPLPNNKPGSLKRLENLVKKLEKQPGMLEKYDEIIRDQLAQGIVESAEGEPEGKEFYIPHKPVVRETAESTKIRIVYDASARAYHQAPSLNDCLETGPPLQNKLWSVLTRNRFHPVALAGDLRQAFLQVRIREEDRDAMRFHWLRDLESKEVETLRFTRALFGMSTSPFLLGGVIEQHLNNLEHKYPDTIEEIRRSLYVDDLISGDKTIARAHHLKEMSQTIFREAKFELHKWHSNVPILERPEYREEGPEEQQSSQGCEAQTYAKDQLGVKGGETKLLGVRWNKATDKIQISFPEAIENVTKREVLGKLAKIYDPLGLASPITLEGKVLYRQACELRIPWDQELPRKQTTKKEMKAYIVLYACSLTRAVYLDLLPSQSTDEFLSSLKRFISRRGRPEKIFSDNGKTFVAAAKWLRNVMKDERLNDFLARQEITWQFNLSRAPWWGGQFERLIGVVKQSLYKSIGNGNLRWHELEEVILDVERIVNDRPLDYVEDDVQMPILTPSVMLFGQPNQLPEEDPSNMEDDSLRKRAKYLRRCKEVLWLRWKNEYLKSLRERHNLNQKTKETALTPGDVVLIKGEERNRGLWRLGVVDKLIPGRDGIVRAVRLRAGKSFLERPAQHLYPLELSCNRNTQEGTARLNARASEFQPRRAAVSARQRIAAIAEDELNEN
ncbi:uncharacterized protein [Montipora capricornis]|uniref:uncharacterized protein n=1 Tax=Montipora capricornis TaxID=246305 RepID=UPI0035F10345